MKSLSCTGWIILLRYEKLKYNSAQVHQKMHWTFVSRNKKNPSRTHITYHHRIFVMQLLFYQELLKNNDSCSTQHYEPFWIKRCRKLLIIFSLAISGKIQRFLGHHSLMARHQDTVSVFWKRDLQMFLVT